MLTRPTTTSRQGDSSGIAFQANPDWAYLLGDLAKTNPAAFDSAMALFGKVRFDVVVDAKRGQGYPIIMSKHLMIRTFTWNSSALRIWGSR